MITSMINPMIRPMISTMINGDSTGGTFRYFLDFDSTLNTYGELAKAKTFSGDFTIKIDFSTTDSVTGQLLLGDSHVTSYFFNIDSNSFDVWFANSSVSFSHTSFTPQDGKLHEVKYVLTGTSLEVFLDENTLGEQTIIPFTGENNFLVGSSNSVATFFQGVIANVDFGDGEIYPINQATADFELPDNNVFGSELWSGVPSIIGEATYTNDVAHILSTAGADSAVFLNSIVIGTVNVISFEIFELVSGAVRVDIGGTTLPAFSANGTFTVAIPESTATLVRFKRNGGITDAKVRNITVKPVTNALILNNAPASNRNEFQLVARDTPELWDDTPVIGSQWTDNGGGSYSYSGDGSLNELKDIILTVGESYLVEFNVDAISGVMKVLNGNVSPTFDSTGRKSLTLNGSTQSTIVFSRNGGTVSCTISDISVRLTAANDWIGVTPILVNGSFSDGLTGWTINNEGGTTGWRDGGDGTAICDGAAVTANRNMGQFELGVGLTYIATTDIGSLSDTISLFFQSGTVEYTTAGIKTKAFTADGTLFVVACGTSDTAIINSSLVNRFLEAP